MKPVFKCDYCTFMGTKEEVKKHEPDCTRNYNMKSCYTCEHAKIDFGTSYKTFQYKCGKEAVELPESSVCAFCTSYERRKSEKIQMPPYFNELFGGFGFKREV